MMTWEMVFFTEMKLVLDQPYQHLSSGHREAIEFT
jgi:hypothetical protein